MLRRRGRGDREDLPNWRRTCKCDRRVGNGAARSCCRTGRGRPHPSCRTELLTPWNWPPTRHAHVVARPGRGKRPNRTRRGCRSGVPDPGWIRVPGSTTLGFGPRRPVPSLDGARPNGRRSGVHGGTPSSCEGTSTVRPGKDPTSVRRASSATATADRRARTSPGCSRDLRPSRRGSVGATSQVRTPRVRGEHPEARGRDAGAAVTSRTPSGEVRRGWPLQQGGGGPAHAVPSNDRRTPAQRVRQAGDQFSHGPGSS